MTWHALQNAKVSMNNMKYILWWCDDGDDDDHILHNWREGQQWNVMMMWCTTNQ